MEELIIADQKYISSKRASEITGYAKDYIGQLCREGRVEARLIGRSWYVRDAAIKDHRFGLENAPTEVDTVKTMGDSTEDEPASLKYIADEAPEAPVIEEKSYFDTATEMQNAWQDWFSKNKQEEAPEPVEIQKIPDEPEVEVEAEIPVFIQKIEEMASEEREELEPEIKLKPDVIMTRQKAILVIPRSSSYVVVKAVLVLLGAVSISIATLGTGLLQVEGPGITASAINYISGIRIFNR